MLTFDEGTHSYWRDGVNVPSVTRILDHAGLVSFDMVRTEILERKSEIGTLVHRATHFYDQGDLDWDSLTDERIRGQTEAWANFRADTGFVPRLIEKQFVCEINGMTFAGTVDRVGMFGNQEAVIDLKTSTAVAPNCAIQTAGYALGSPAREVGTPYTLFSMRRRMVVQLFPDGKYRKFDFTDKNDLTVFVSGLHITYWKLQQGMKLKSIMDAA